MHCAIRCTSKLYWYLLDFLNHQQYFLRFHHEKTGEPTRVIYVLQTASFMVTSPW